MADDHLTSDERVVLRMHSHAKALAWPVLALLVLTAGLGAGLAVAPEKWGMPGDLGVVGLYVVLVLWLSVWPWVVWMNETFTVTTHRVMMRRGVLTKRGHDLPLRRVNNVTSDRSLTDRLLGCGTLVLETAAEQPLVLDDVPRVRHVQRVLGTLLLQSDPVERTHDGRIV